MKCVLMLMLIIGTALLFTNAEEKVMPPTDIAVILDSSKSVKKYRWHFLTGFFNDLVRRLNYGPESTHMAAIQFSTNAKEVITLGQYDTVESVTQAMDKVPYKRGSGNSHTALNMLVDKTLSQANVRPGVPRVAVLVTDDESRKTCLTNAAIQRVKDDGIRMVVVGIKHSKWFNYQQLVKFAGGNESSVTVVKGFDGLTNAHNLDIIVKTIFNATESATEPEQEEQDCTDPDDWTAPEGWTGPVAAYYKSFDNTKCMTLHNGAKLGPGKHGQAITTEYTKHQYVDLGVIVKQACIITPSTCGATGGSLSAWVKTREGAKGFSGFTLVSKDEPNRKTLKGYTEGLFVNNIGRIESTISASDYAERRISKQKAKIDQWLHILVVYHGDTSKHDLYINGNKDNDMTIPYKFTYKLNVGNVVIGRRFTSYNFTKPLNYDYSSVAVDELLFFNRALTEKEVKNLYSSYS